MLLRHCSRWLAIAAIAAATAVSLAVPATASADGLVAACPAIYPRPAYCDGGASHSYATVGPQHVGWVYLNLNHCATGLLCAKIHRISTSAWSWSGTAWSQRSLRGGWVYVYPYTGAWRWAWTQESGWVAISGHRFELR